MDIRKIVDHLHLVSGSMKALLNVLEEELTACEDQQHEEEEDDDGDKPF